MPPRTLTFFETFIEAFSKAPLEARDLGGYFVECPPIEDYGYPSTPSNAVTFSTMGVDGVHDAILKIDERICDHSPVVKVSPMDSQDVFIIAETFLDFLSIGCDVSKEQIESIFQRERSGEVVLVSFLAKHFDGIRLLDEGRLSRLERSHAHHIQRE